MTTPRSGHFAGLLTSGPDAGQVLIVGGDGASTAELFDPDSETFTPVATSGTLGVYNGTPAWLADGRILFTGVRPSGSEDYSQAVVFNPDTAAFADVPGFGGDRRAYTTTALNDGRALIVGGYRGTEGLDSVRMFDPATDEISEFPPLDHVRYLHSAAVLGSGRVVLFSGLPEVAVFHDDALIFDPVDDSFSPAEGTVEVGRGYSLATPLSSGEVFVLGGQVALPHSGSAILSTVDIIDE